MLIQPVQPTPDPCRNAKGYDVAEIFRSKLTHVSPVWLQLREETGSLAVTGQHDIDKGWVQRMRKPPLKVSPAQQMTACSLGLQRCGPAGGSAAQVLCELPPSNCTWLIPGEPA